MYRHPAITRHFYAVSIALAVTDGYGDLQLQQVARVA